MARVLLVEDQVELRNAYSTLLTELGHDVSSAENGREALTWLSNNDHPDVVLMDMEMPIMTGVEAIREIRSRDELADLMIVLLTSHQRPDEVGEGLSSGADAYVVKPVDPGELIAELQLILGDGGGE